MLIEYPAPEIGALISAVDVRTMSDTDWCLIYQTWLERNVIVVRDQSLRIEDFLAYARRFGRVKPHWVRRTRHPDHPEVTLMSAPKNLPASGDAVVFSRNQDWLADAAWDTEVCKATLLYALELPSYGGDTLFANMYAAYDALPRSLKERIEGLQVEFAFGGQSRDGVELLEPDDRAHPPAVHPLVRVHPETGRKALYVNPTHVLRIVGIPEAEGERLLHELFWYMTQPGAEYRHKWRVGDLVTCDNRSSVHCATGGSPSNEPSIHWRTTVMDATAPAPREPAQAMA